ncbi:hypothetical protein, partial [Tsukamurella ocularis]
GWLPGGGGGLRWLPNEWGEGGGGCAELTEQWSVLLDLLSRGRGLVENSQQRCQVGADLAVERGKAGRELVGAISKLEQVASA